MRPYFPFLSLLITGFFCGILMMPANGQETPGFSEPGRLAKTTPVFREACRRWDSVLGDPALIKGFDPDTLRLLSGKCIFTLLNNRQGPSGGLKHEGIYPSWKDFQGFWAWDSWKHAFALASIMPGLAKNNIRAMFDYQDSSGMVADCIFPDTTENNYRDTKPPLASWAVLEIASGNHDTAFAREMFPALLEYHRWWYVNRDHDHDGLCEYGSTDGTLQAARWESGWDNAVRFDSAIMLQNGPHAWSMSQESVDLNSYLYVEKECLASLAMMLGNDFLASVFRVEAIKLAELIRSCMWDEQYGFFFDIDIRTKKPILVPEPNGWLPLWAGIATKRQAHSVMEHIMDTAEFNTFVPFPTVAANHPGFSPEKGYWRGPVWLDQAYFALQGLRLYGYDRQADQLLNKIFRHCEGLLAPDAPIRENYHPLDGKGLNAEDFSWSAACLLMMISDLAAED